MQQPKMPQNEPARLAELRALNILDTPPEKAYDHITEILADFLGVPIALVSLVDDKRQWFKSRTGLEATQTPREISFCGHVVETNLPLIVEDASKDERFADNPLVTGSPDIRFYAGWPLKTECGNVLGTLCAIDNKPRSLSPQQARLLEYLAEQISLIIELRHRTSEADRYKQIATANSIQLGALTAAQENFIAGSKTSEVFNSLLQYLLEISKSEYGFIGEVLRNENGKPFLRTHAITNIAWNEQTREFYEKHRFTGMDFFNLETLFGRVMTDETVMIANDPYHHPRRGGLPPGHPALNAFLGIPIKKAGMLIGMVGVANRPGGYDNDLVCFLDPFISTCANIMLANKTALAKEAADQALRETLQKMASMNSELVRSNEDLSQFAYIASHDLQAPLRHIGTYVDFIQQDLAETASKDVQDGLAIVKQSVVRMRSMIDDILTYARVGSQELSFTSDNLLLLAKSAMDELTDDIQESGAQITTGAMPDIFCDGKKLKLVFQNLIQNAIKYRRPGTVPLISITSRQDGENIVVSVEDNGQGIPPQYREAVFKMFQRVPGVNKTPGTGIGLAICKKIVERHGGTIWIESAQIHGSRFCFSLPKVKS